MSRAFFDDVADALTGFLPPSMRAFACEITPRNLKVWFGDVSAEHYEAQLISRAALAQAKIRSTGSMLEIGFHAEHKDEARNDEVLARITARERTWRRALGRAPEAGRFAGRQRGWRRISELWDGGDVAAPEAAIEAADRLATYIRCIEPLRRPDTQPARPRA